MPNNRDRVIQCLKDHPTGLCVECLSKKAGVRPRQTVFKILQELEMRGQVRKQKAQCAGGDDRAKNVYQWLGSRLESPGAVDHPPLPDGPSTPGLKEQTDRLSDYLYRMTQMLNGIDKGKEPQEPFAGRVKRLREPGPLPGSVAAMMLTLNSLRVLVVKDRLRLGCHEWDVVKHAWAAVQDWWTRRA